MTRVLGILSLIFWSLTIVVSLKYLLLLMRADNNGEGGILALLALLSRWRRRSSLKKAALIAIGVFGAALLYGDGMITPAISVLSAVEGLEIARLTASTPISSRSRSPFWRAVLRSSRGARSASARCSVRSRWSGSSCWPRSASFRSGTIPASSRALNPVYARRFFFVQNGGPAFIILGAVFLVVTGERGALRGYGAFRQGADPLCLVLLRPALPRAQLFRPGRAGAGDPAPRGPAFLPPRARIGPATR